MKSLREIIPENIIKLRKQQGLTQLGLAKKINYSDKAVSRWENSEVLPDIETLDNLAKIFNVPLSYLLEEHTESSEVNVSVPKNEIAFKILMVIAVWTVTTILFVFGKLYYDKSIWQLFVWAVPVSVIVISYFNRKKKNKHVTFACRTILCWSLLTALYLQFLSFNAWIVFIIGVPIQAAIMVSYLATFIKKKKP